jgi:aminoglycoside 6-adenylyltransferase
VLTSSLTNPNAPSDILSDFDVELFFEDPAPFVESDDWIETIGMGPVMALWHWPNEWDEEKGSGRRWMRMVYFGDGTKMDISLCFLDILREFSRPGALPDGYDIGYRVLVDKDGVTGTLTPPTYRAFILKPPTSEHYASRVETFWMESTYVAKFLWREDIVAAKWMLNGLIDRNLRQMLEWCVAAGRNWTWKPGAIGRGLDKALDPDTRREMIECYAGGEIDDLWQSLSHTTALYGKAAVSVADCLGYSYPHDLDERVTSLHRTVKSLDRKTGTREELARMLGRDHRSS